MISILFAPSFTNSYLLTYQVPGIVVDTEKLEMNPLPSSKRIRMTKIITNILDILKKSSRLKNLLLVNDVGGGAEQLS